MTAGDRANMELRDYLWVLRRRRSLIVLTTLVVAASALALSLLQDPVYQGRARLILQAQQSVFADSDAPRWDAALVETEVQVIRSEPVRVLVRERLGGSPNVDIVRVGETAVVELRAESGDRTRAATIANTYAEAYIEHRRKQEIDNVEAAGRELQARVDSLQKTMDDLSRRMGELPPCSPPRDIASCDERTVVQRDRDALVTQQVPLKQKLDELRVATSLREGAAELVTPATPPTSPIRPTPLRNGLLGGAVGLLFGVALAFLFEHLDDTIKSKEDLERAARGIEVLGMIPSVPGWKSRSEARLVSQTEPTSPAAEAYRALRTSIQFLALDRPLRWLQITSPNASEGKTTTTANLAVALSQAGTEVVVLSCDLRQPRIHQFFGLPNDVGFTSVLLGEEPLSRGLQAVPGQERLRLLASGALPPNPSELLTSRRTADVMHAVHGQCDLVLIDSPPVLPVTDAAVLAGRADATLLVVTVGTTTKRQVARAVELLRQVNARIIGAVLNNVPAESAYSYSYYYYGQEDDDGVVDGKRARRSAVDPSSEPPVVVPDAGRPSGRDGGP